MTRMRMTAATASTFAMALFVMATPALATPPRASCDIDLQELGEAKINHYNALDGGDYLEQIRLRLHNKGDKPCTGVIKISRISGTPEMISNKGGKISYTIVDQNDFSRVLYDPLTNNSNAIIVSVPAKSKVDISPRLAVPGSQPGRAGRYAATLEAGFYLAGDLTATDTARFNVSAQVTASVQANFVGSSNPQNARLDLGELEPNKQGKIGLQVRSSSDYSISFRSENGGKLAGPVSSTVPYSLTYAGRMIDLSRKKATEQFSPSDPVRPQTNEINVIIGQFSNARAGNYRDQVTITISAY